MHKLIIVQKYDILTGWPDEELLLDTEFDTSAQAELRALRWLTYRPNDIVMLEELQTSVCIHCGVPIQEKAGWVRHRWIHEGGHYACVPNNGRTQATPKEAGLT